VVPRACGGTLAAGSRADSDLDHYPLTGCRTLIAGYQAALAAGEGGEELSDVMRVTASDGSTPLLGSVMGTLDSMLGDARLAQVRQGVAGQPAGQMLGSLLGSTLAWRR